MKPTYEYSELTSPMSYRQAKKAAPPRVNSRWIAIVFTLSVYTGLMLFGFFRELGKGNFNPAFLGMAALTLAGIVACFYVYRSQTIKAARLKRFAQKNNLELIVNEQPIERDSVLFGQGDQRSVLFGFRDTNTNVEVGQYRYITGFNYGARIWQYTYAAMHSATMLPSIYIHSRKNDIPARSTTDITRSIKDMPAVDYGADFSEKFVVHNLGATKAAELPAAVKAWLLQQGDDFDYILWDTNVILFRRGYIRFTKFPDLQQFFNFVNSFKDAIQEKTGVTNEPVFAPQPAFHAGQTRRLIYRTGLFVVGAAVLYSVARAVVAFT